MHECQTARIDARERTTGRERGIVRRRGARLAATMALVAGAAALLPGAASAAGTLSSGDYTGPAGTQHYELYVPSSYKPGTPVPLVVALHGCTQTADGFRQLTRWDTVAEAKGFIVAFAQQDSNSNSFACWNFFQDASMHRSAGEPARIDGVTSYVEQKYSIDPKRVYAAGLSAGGAMASVMAATYPDVFAAIGIGSGCEYAATATCAGYKSADPTQAAQAAYKEMGSRARPIPFVAFEGDADTTVPPVNADQLVQQWLTTGDLADDGTANGSIPLTPANTTQGQAAGGRTYTTRTYNDHNHSELAQYWLVHGMNHAWSGGNPAQQYADASGPDETTAMYTFFQNHPMTSSRGTTPGPTPSPPVVPTPPTSWFPTPPASWFPTLPTSWFPTLPKFVGGQIVFTTARRGSVTVRLEQRVAPHAKYTTRAKLVGKVAKGRRVAITLPKTVHGKRLSPGRYRAVLTVAGTSGHAGTPHTLALVLR
jgi:poly(hydroxyalkanoate) depolymerase family esterase